MCPIDAISRPAGSIANERLPFNGQALVSVIIPTHNRVKLLNRAIDSVVRQSYTHWEIIVVDDYSNDGTLDSIQAMGDARIRLERTDAQRGAGFCRDIGAQRSRGDFVAFLDSDDYWLQDKLKIQLVIAEQTASDHVVVLCPPAADNGLQITPVRQPAIRPGQSIADYVYTGKQATILSSCLLIAGDFGRAVRFDPALRVNQDTDYLLRLEREGALFKCNESALYILDVRRRSDRMIHDPDLRDESIAWYTRVSGRWSTAARRGYFFWDLSVRCASIGQRKMGLQYYVRGFSSSAGPYRVVRQLLRVIGGGDVPRGISKLRMKLRPNERPDRLALPGSF